MSKRAGRSASQPLQNENKRPKVSSAIITKKRLCHELLEDEPAYRELVESSIKLKLPQGTPLELLRFLYVLNQDFNNTMVGSGLSPSCKLDTLWHHMLLNTKLRQAVTDLLGFEVEHSTASASDAQVAKIERQLRAMTRLEIAGFWGSPCLQVWAEKGTAMEILTRVEGAGGAPVTYKCVPQAARPAVEGGSSSSKDDVQAAKPLDSSSIIKLYVQRACGSQVAFQLPKTTHLGLVYKLMAERDGMDVHKFRLYYDGNVVQRADSPESLGAVDGDVLDQTIVQSGC